MSQQIPAWWRVVEAAEEHEDLRALHRADGVLTAQEHAAEEAHFRSRLFAAAVDAAECADIGQAISRVGPESGHARRKLAARERRLAQVLPFPGAGTDPQDGGPAAMALAA